MMLDQYLVLIIPIIQFLLFHNAKLWHLRLGHLSDSMLKSASHKIPFVVPYDFSLNKCTICPLAKLKRLPLIPIIIFLLKVLILYIVIYGGLMEKLLMMAKSIF